MADELSNRQSGRDSSASAIFTEIMQQAAARQTVTPAEPKSTESPPDTDRPPGPTAAESSSEAPNGPDESAVAERRRVQRIKRRPGERSHSPLAATGVFFRTLFVVLVSAGLVATILTWLTDPQFLNPAVVRGLQGNEAALMSSDVQPAAPAPVTTPNWLQRIGIISGHRGLSRNNIGNDPGAVCEDGLEEADINFEVARRVVDNLRARNYTVDLLDEFDARLDNYRAAALLSIHANTCADFGERVSGYLVAKASSRPDGGIDAYFVECVAFHYEELIPLERSHNLTLDMTDNHAWRKIHPLTPGVIIEMGYMLADRQILTEEPELLAQALTQGILCLLGSPTSYPALPP